MYSAVAFGVQVVSHSAQTGATLYPSKLTPEPFVAES